MAYNSLYDGLYNVFIRSGTIAVIFYTTFYLIDKTIQHGDKIKKL